MKISSLAKYAIGITTSAAMLAACSSGSGSSSLPVSGVSPAFRPVGHGAVINGVITTAWRSAPAFVHPIVSPDKKKKKATSYQYISDFDLSDVLQFEWPKKDSSIATISGIDEAQGMCAQTPDKSPEYWVTASGSEAVDEFKVGGKSAEKTLSVASFGSPAGCGVSTKGDVAVSIISGGDVVVFTGGKGSGKEYTDGLEETFFTNFDDKGDLFVDGFNDAGGVGVAELPAGKKTFSTITLSNTVEFPGNIQWDGKYITVNDQEGFAIYQYTIKGTSGKLEGTVSYSGASDCDQDWIAGTYVICPDISNGLIYNYPKGGSAQATLTGSMEESLGSVATAIAGKKKK